MTESIPARLDREVKRLGAEQANGITSVSESYINGVEHAANIAYRMGDEFVPVEKVTAAILAAWLPQRDTESVLIRCALRIVARELGIDLDAALAGPAEATKEAQS